MEMQEGCDDLKSSSLHPTIPPSQAMMNTHAQLYLNEPEKYLPIANIGRIMKNTLDPPRVKKHQIKKTKNTNNKASIDKLFNNPDEEQKELRQPEILPGVQGVRDND